MNYRKQKWGKWELRREGAFSQFKGTYSDWPPLGNKYSWWLDLLKLSPGRMYKACIPGHSTRREEGEGFTPPLLCPTGRAHCPAAPVIPPSFQIVHVWASRGSHLKDKREAKVGGERHEQEVRGHGLCPCAVRLHACWDHIRQTGWKRWSGPQSKARPRRFEMPRKIRLIYLDPTLNKYAHRHAHNTHT